MCSYNNNILISIPSHQYVLMNRSSLCSCDIEPEGNFLLESLAACDNFETKTDLAMCISKFGFVNYFDNVIVSRHSNFKELDNAGTKFAHISGII